MLKRAPLVRFSLYSHAQVDAVKWLSSDLLARLDVCVSDGAVDGEGFQHIYGLFWLWVLGAYEVTRTMSEYKTCFSERLQGDIASFKKSISVLRIPFAKQQFQGRDKRPIAGENSVYALDTKKKDLCFEIEGKNIWMRDLIEEFDGFVGSITIDDVLGNLRDASLQKS